MSRWQPATWRGTAIGGTRHPHCSCCCIRTFLPAHMNLAGCFAAGELTCNASRIHAPAGLSLWGFTSVVFAPSPALPHPLGSWPGLPDTLGPAEAGLRRMAGAGLLLAAAAAHALFDFSASVRQKPYLGDVDNVKEAIIMWVG